MAGSLTFKQTAEPRSDSAHGWLYIDDWRWNGKPNCTTQALCWTPSSARG